MSRSRDLGDVGSKANFLDNVSTDLGDFSGQSIPHIIPGVLYPAVEGKDLAGVAFSGSYVYGTVHTDNRKYYYTDIKGSRPIHDPRIGSHFGSQRHMFKSLQLLEQETAINGKEVYSIDGREWASMCGTTFVTKNDANGNRIYSPGVNGTDFFEIVGYFSDINLLFSTHSARPDNCDVLIDGNDVGTNHSQKTTEATPLSDRFVDPASVSNVSLGSTALGIHTLKYIPATTSSSGSDCNIYGIELIAHDTSNVNEIKIPKQNVVSYGKKFEIGSDDLNNSVHPHYDPFTTMSYGGSGTTLSALQSLIDTDTSLGMDAWKAGTSNYHRPWNGGRIIKWVDSSGVIKTSVNMMPPNAQNIGTTASNAVSDAHVIAGTNDDTINFNTSAIDHSQAEVAKTFNWREFGNGNANAGPVTGSTGGSYKDFSMLYEFTATDCAFVMDDGLTSLSAEDVHIDTKDVHGDADGDGFYFTFIGTGITLMNKESSAGTDHLAQNLPFGSHIVKYFRSSGADPTLLVDGVTITCATGTYTSLNEITFHQPKKPPIPEEAVIISDYCLMADYVPMTTSANGSEVSKGVRLQSSSRDVFWSGATGGIHTAMNINASSMPFGLNFLAIGAYEIELPFFGTRFEGCIESSNGYANNDRIKIDGSTVNHTGIDSSYNDRHDFVAQSVDSTLGVHTGATVNLSTGATHRLGVVTPIHTSFHYTDGNKTNPKTGFETPFLNELVGGDRNLEQHTLICTPFGNTWDEVTRDTSYIGKGVLSANNDTDRDDGAAIIIMDEWRGTPSGEHNPNFNKDWAIAYDRVICLVDGQYEFNVQTLGTSSASAGFMHNGTVVVKTNASTEAQGTQSQAILNCKRGDYIQVLGDWYQNEVYNNYTITRL